MDIGLSDEQELLKNSAREFLAKECPEAHVRAMEADANGYGPELWRKLTEMGWHGLMIPAQFGGSGMTFYDLCIVVEAAGRALLPGPFIPNQVAVGLILESGSEAQREKYLPAIADGSQIHTYAIAESTGRWGAEDITLQARRTRDGIVLSGAKLFVPNANVADVIWVIAHDGNGFVAAAVPRTAKGVRIASLATMTGEKLAEVVLDDVSVAREDVIELANFDSFANRATVL